MKERHNAQDLTLEQGWAVTLPEGRQWVLDLNEWTGQVVWEANLPNVVWRLAKSPA